MKVLIGTQELLVRNHYAQRFPNGRLVLKMEIPEDEISYSDLKALIKGNTDDIVATNDDGTEHTYSGFGYTVQITDKDDGYLYCELECVSEAEYQIGLLKAKVREQDTIITNQAIAFQNKVQRLQEEINNVNTGSADGASWDEIASAIEEGVNEV